MKKRVALKILASTPVAVLKEGIKYQKENYYRINVKKKYHIDQLETIDILDVFPGFNGSIDNYSFLQGSSLITDIMLLKLFAKTFEKCSYLEIGCWKGESISNVADAADECVSVTLSETEMRDLNFGEEFISCHGIFSKGRKNITTIGHNSHTFDFFKLEKKFDLIFIDGDHSYEGVLVDTKKVFPLLKNDHSVIVWHDYGFDTEEVRHSVLNGILDGIPGSEHKCLYHVSNTMCAVYIKDRKFKTKRTKFPDFPNKKFLIEIKAEKI